MQLLQSRAARAAEYTPELCETIAKGLQIELSSRSELNPLFIGNLEMSLHEEPCYEEYFDANTGESLEPGLVEAGRAKEIDQMIKRSVYDVVPMSVMSSAAKLVGVTWVDVWKSTEVRSRLCAQEFAAGDIRDDLFAGTPPLAIARMLVSLAAQDRSLKLMAADVSCAFL